MAGEDGRMMRSAGSTGGADRGNTQRGLDVTTQSMTPADKQALRSTADLHRPLARAAAVARSNALGYAVFGALTLLVALFGPDVLGLAIGAVVTGVGVAQLRAAPRLRHGDPAAPRVLARNELVLMGGIIGYCLLKLTLLRESGADLQSQVGDTGDLDLGIGELIDSLNTTMYSAFLAVTLVYQGGLALYFLRRRPIVERYLVEAPDWARATVESLRE